MSFLTFPLTHFPTRGPNTGVLWVNDNQNMISALLYLQWQSTKNRLVSRVKRLKQPKYLLGAIVGGLYFYFYIFRWMLGGHGRGGAGLMPVPVLDPLIFESIGALILFGIVLLAWIIPHERAALTFTEAEVAFLFPAPVSRRALIHFKLLRSQLAILVTILFLTLIFRRSGGNAGIHAAGWWVVLSTLNLHLLASSFAMTKLMDHGITKWWRRLAVLALALIGAAVVGGWAVRALPPLAVEELANFAALKEYARQVFASGPLPYLLFPFRLIVRPYFAPDGIAFLNALWPALLLLAAHYWWVVRADVAFEEASVEASKKLADKVAAVRAGNWSGANSQRKKKRAPFRLAAVGFPPFALLWKNLINAGQAFTARIWVMLAIVIIFISFGARGSASGSNWLPVVGVVAGSLCLWALLLGPQIVRLDFRQDLPHADLLKTYPLRGWQIALGELLAPVVILTGIHWLLLIVAVVFGSQFSRGVVSGGLILALGVGAAIVLSMLNAISLLIPNAAVLMFPGWFQTGKGGPQGIEATGQRLIFALGQFLAFIIALVPAAGVFTGIFFLVKFMVGAALAVVVASAAAAVVLALEAGLGVLLLGWLFDRFDVAAEPTT